MNRMTVQFPLPVLLAQVVHGIRHMHPVDLIFRAVLALSCLVVGAWMILRGEVVWPLVLGVLGSLSVAVDAVELYAAATVCDRLAELEEEDR